MLDNARHALKVHEVFGQRAGQANVVTALGWYLAGRGDHHEALVKVRTHAHTFARTSTKTRITR